MLTLSRKIGEAIYIDRQIVVTVVKISGNRVKVGIKAPDEVRILRSELNEGSDVCFDQPATPR